MSLWTTPLSVRRAERRWLSQRHFRHLPPGLRATFLLKEFPKCLSFEELGYREGYIFVGGEVENLEYVWMRGLAMALASRSNLRRRSGSFASASGNTLMAASRSNRSSRARCTTPIPPAPICSTMR